MRHACTDRMRKYAIRSAAGTMDDSCRRADWLEQLFLHKPLHTRYFDWFVHKIGCIHCGSYVHPLRNFLTVRTSDDINMFGRPPRLYARSKRNGCIDYSRKCFKIHAALRNHSIDLGLRYFPKHNLHEVSRSSEGNLSVKVI